MPLVNKEIYKHSYDYWSKKIQVDEKCDTDEDFYSLLLAIFELVTLVIVTKF